MSHATHSKPFFSIPRITALSIAIACSLASPAFAAQTPADAPDGATPETLDTVIVTGTKADDAFGEKSGIPLSRMPQSVQVIDAEQIQTQGARSVGDLLRNVPSANPGNSRVARYQSFSLKVRGFLADQMRNGIRQRYYEDIDASAMSNVDRLEILKGPSSVLYGQSAVGGIISVITQRPESGFGGSATIRVGEHDERVAGFDVTGAIGGSDRFAARLTGEIERSGTFVDGQDIDRNNIALAARWKVSDAVTVHWLSEYIERETLGYAGLPVVGTVVGNGRGTVSRERFLGEPSLRPLTADSPLIQLWADIELSESWTLSPRYQYQGFRTDFSQVRLRSMQADGATVNRNGRYGTEDDDYQIAQLDLSGHFDTGRIGHKLLVGIEASREDSTFLQYNLTDVAPINSYAPIYTYPGVAPTTAFSFDFAGLGDGTAFYAQDLISLTPSWDIIAGIRHSRFDYEQTNDGIRDASEVSATTWQLATNLRLSDRWSLFGGVNTGFDTESILGARDANGNTFDPERSEQLEAGVRLNTDRNRLSVAVLDISRKDALTADPVDPDFSVQDGEQRVRGIELEGVSQLTADWDLTWGVARLDGKVTRSNDGDQNAELGDTPKLTGLIRSRYAIAGTPWSFDAGVYAVSDRRLVNGSDVRLPGYGLVDLGVQYARDDWSIGLTINNALDKTYYSASGNVFSVLPGEPRHVGLRVRHAF
ncbi:MAG: TonB-dependent siderophore receptor [Lysobacter sp.]|nr:TonB-dependent siderophore receptor [Lysobacter sp.]